MLEIFKILKEKSQPDQLVEFRSCPEKHVIGKYHFGLGLFIIIRNHFKLWQGGEWYQYFREMGLHDPDDVSSVVIMAWHRYLNKKDWKKLYNPLTGE